MYLKQIFIIQAGIQKYIYCLLSVDISQKSSFMNRFGTCKFCHTKKMDEMARVGA